MTKAEAIAEAKAAGAALALVSDAAARAEVVVLAVPWKAAVGTVFAWATSQARSSWTVRIPSPPISPDLR